MAKRLHKNLNPEQVQAAGEQGTQLPNLFDNVLYNGKPLEDLTTAARRVNPNWPAYNSDICVETFSFDYTLNTQFDVPHLMVLRATLSCCCDVYCNYPGHSYEGGGAFSTAMTTAVSDMTTPRVPTHAPGKDYVESVLDVNTLTPIKVEAENLVPDEAGRTNLAKEIKAEADALTITADDIESQVGVNGVDTNGLLSTPGAAAAVLAGTSTVAMDYVWVAAFVILFQRIVAASHTKLTRDWPQRGTPRNVKF